MDQSQYAKPMNVIVVGGSLSGLMYGLMIKKLGHNVRVLERATTSTRAGQAAGMGTGPRGTEFMQLHDSYRSPYAFKSPYVQYLDQLGHVKRTSAWPLSLTSWDVLYFRLRANFDGLESDYYPQAPEASESDGSAVYDVGKMAVATSLSDGLVRVEFQDLIHGGAGSFEAHLVIVADGSNSKIRESLLPDLKPSYSGYIAWRGTVPEKDVGQGTADLFDTGFNVFAMKRGYIVGYAMPGKNGSLEKGQRVFNFVWYYNCPENSTAYEQIMTDTEGHLYRNTLPTGKMRPETLAKLKADARQQLNPPFAELVEKTTKPFISTVRDCASARATFHGGRLILVGEALTLYRPHTGISFNQSARDCLELRKVLQHQQTLETWETEAIQTQMTTSTMATVCGEYYQSGVMSTAFLYSAFRFIVAMAMSRFMRFWVKPRM